MNINQDDNRPKLKKIKRPINRTVPIGESPKLEPMAPSATGFQNPMQRPAPAQNAQGNTQVKNDYSSVSPQPSMYVHSQRPDSKELNEYLDGGHAIQKVQERTDSYSPNYLDEDEYYNNNTAVASAPEWLTTKTFVMIVCVALFLGILAGRFLFSQSSVVHNGLQGVVVNAEVPRGRARCGIAERTQGCVLYIMNPQRQEMSAKDFYDLASQVTGRQRFMIETGNMRYANSKIRPGDIVQLNIPPL